MDALDALNAGGAGTVAAGEAASGAGCTGPAGAVHVGAAGAGEEALVLVEQIAAVEAGEADRRRAAVVAGLHALKALVNIGIEVVAISTIRHAAVVLEVEIHVAGGAVGADH